MNMKVKIIRAAVIVALAGFAAYLSLGSIADSGKVSTTFKGVTAAFIASDHVELDAPADRLRTSIVNECSVAGNEVLRKAAADAAIGQAFGFVRAKSVLTVGDVNTLLGSPASVAEPDSVGQCLRSLAAFYAAYPDKWALIGMSSATGNSLAEVEDLFEDHLGH